MRITVAAVAILALVAVCWADNPGIKARITNRGLDMVLRSAIKSAMKEVRTNPPRLSTKAEDTSDDGFFSLVSGTLYWPKLVNGTFGSASLTAVRNSHLELTLNGAAMNISVKLRKGKDNRHYDRRISGYDISFDVNFYINDVKRIHVTYSACSLSRMEFIDTFPHVAGASGRTMRLKLQAVTCELIRRFIGEKLNVEIGKATSPGTIWEGKTTYKMPKTGKRESVKIELMYEFAKTTSYGKDYVDVYLTGDVYQDGKNTAKQFTPAAFPANAPVNKMLYFWLSEAVFNNIFNVAHDVQIFKRWIGQLTVIKTAAAPTASFKRSGVSFKVMCDIIKYTLHGIRVTKSMSMEVNVDVTLNLKGKIITTAVSGKSLKFKNIKGFQSMKTAMGKVAVKFITKILSSIKLPLPKNLKLLNSVITPKDGFIMIGADAEIRM